MKCPLVMIEWVDSVQPRSSWEYLTDIGNPGAVKCVSVGWLISETKKCKSLAPNIGEIDSPETFQVSGLIVIPTRAITKITRLKEPNVRR